MSATTAIMTARCGGCHRTYQATIDFAAPGAPQLWATLLAEDGDWLHDDRGRRFCSPSCQSTPAFPPEKPLEQSDLFIGEKVA